jgi:hypothetical protein
VFRAKRIDAFEGIPVTFRFNSSFSSKKKITPPIIESIASQISFSPGKLNQRHVTIIAVPYGTLGVLCEGQRRGQLHTRISASGKLGDHNLEKDGTSVEGWMTRQLRDDQFVLAYSEAKNRFGNISASCPRV